MKLELWDDMWDERWEMRWEIRWRVRDGEIGWEMRCEMRDEMRDERCDKWLEIEKANTRERKREERWMTRRHSSKTRTHNSESGGYFFKT